MEAMLTYSKTSCHFTVLTHHLSWVIRYCQVLADHVSQLLKMYSSKKESHGRENIRGRKLNVFLPLSKLKSGNLCDDVMDDADNICCI